VWNFSLYLNAMLIIYIWTPRNWHIIHNLNKLYIFSNLGEIGITKMKNLHALKVNSFVVCTSNLIINMVELVSCNFLSIKKSFNFELHLSPVCSGESEYYLHSSCGYLQIKILETEILWKFNDKILLFWQSDMCGEDIFQFSNMFIV
jgi:hypothetical protein